MAASGGNIDNQTTSMATHVGYLERIAAWSQQASVSAKELSARAEDGRGGPTPNRALRAIIAELILTYEHVLGIRVTHTEDKDSHVAEYGFAAFIKQALRLYAPEGAVFEPVLIDNVVLETLDLRSSELSAPPPLRKR